GEGGRDAVRLLHARPGRVCIRPGRRERTSDARRDPASDGREHLPLRHLSEDRGGDSPLARLIRTEKEVEGRYEEVWLVVDEDALEQWPQGPRTIVGRPALRQDAPQRVRGEARYTADLQLPGTLHAAVLRSPFAHARVKRIDVAPALEEPGVRAALGPGDLDVLTDVPGYFGAAVAAVAAETYAQARAALTKIDVEWEQLEAIVDPEEAVRREQLGDEPRRYERGDFERA